MTVRNGRALFVVDPPVKKRFVGNDVKALFGGGVLANALEKSAPNINRFSTAETE